MSGAMVGGRQIDRKHLADAPATNHRDAAEQCLVRASGNTISTESQELWLAEAQVHATLAVAAATQAMADAIRTHSIDLSATPFGGTT